MMARVKKLLWTAVTPLALTVLLTQPGAGADEPRAERAPVVDEGEHPTLETGHEEHELVTNPIQNFASFDYRSKDAHGGTWEKGEHKMPPPFSMTILNFLAFAALVGRMGGPSLKRVVRERHDDIAKALAESGRLRDEARARLAEYERKTAALDSEIAALVAGIRNEAEAEKKRIITDAEARAERMQRDAELQIQAEIQRVRMTLEREAVVAAVNIAETLLREKTGDADQKQLADKFIKGLGEAAVKRRPRA